MMMEIVFTDDAILYCKQYAFELCEEEEDGREHVGVTKRYLVFALYEWLSMWCDNVVDPAVWYSDDERDQVALDRAAKAKATSIVDELMSTREIVYGNTVVEHSEGATLLLEVRDGYNWRAVYGEPLEEE